MLKCNRKCLIGIASVILIIIMVVLLVIFLQPTTTTTSATPTPSTSPLIFDNSIPVNITTTINNELVCIGLSSTTPFVLQYGNCGDPSIQGTWSYDRTNKVLTNTNTLTAQRNCIINPSTIADPRVFGLPTVNTSHLCFDLGVTMGSDVISGKNDSVFISLLHTSLGWTTLRNTAITFNIVETD